MTLSQETSDPLAAGDRLAAGLRLVRKRAYWVARRIPNADVKDLIGAGSLGLAEALARYQPGPAAFEGYADYRITGAIYDELRSKDLLSRDMRELADKLAHAAYELTDERGLVPDETVVAARACLPLELAREVMALARVRRVDGFFDRVDTQSASPDLPLVSRELRKAMADLPERLRNVLEAYYWQEQTLLDIGVSLGLSESRACQLLRDGLALLRNVYRPELWEGL